MAPFRRTSPIATRKSGQPIIPGTPNARGSREYARSVPDDETHPVEEEESYADAPGELSTLSSPAQSPWVPGSFKHSGSATPSSPARNDGQLGTFLQQVQEHGDGESPPREDVLVPAVCQQLQETSLHNEERGTVGGNQRVGSNQGSRRGEDSGQETPCPSPPSNPSSATAGQTQGQSFQKLDKSKGKEGEVQVLLPKGTSGEESVQYDAGYPGRARSLPSSTVNGREQQKPYVDSISSTDSSAEKARIVGTPVVHATTQNWLVLLKNIFVACNNIRSDIGSLEAHQLADIASEMSNYSTLVNYSLSENKMLRTAI